MVNEAVYQFSLFRLVCLLYITVILASLRSSRKTHFSRQQLIRRVNRDKQAWVLFLRILDGISPFLVALLEGKFKISFFFWLTFSNFRLYLEWIFANLILWPLSWFWKVLIILSRFYYSVQPGFCIPSRQLDVESPLRDIYLLRMRLECIMFSFLIAWAFGSWLHDFKLDFDMKWQNFVFKLYCYQASYCVAALHWRLTASFFA